MSRDPCYNKDTWPPFNLVLIIFILFALLGLFTCAKVMARIKSLEFHVRLLEDDVRRLKK